MYLFKKLLFCILIFLSAGAWAQPAPQPTIRTCGTDQVRQQLIRQSPGLLLKMERIREQVKTSQARRKQARLTLPVIQIPIVFHVVYNTPEQNISEAQLLSQLQVLNEDFRRRNADTSKINAPFKKLAADTNIQFCLATLDPNGQPTSGITRTRTSQTAFSMNDAIKFSSRGGHDAWNTDKYLNIWIGNMGSSTLGYAQYPGSPANIDGVVLHYRTIGRFPDNPNERYAYNLGRTATHEIGHYLGLDHIWGNLDASCEDSDGIDDTPPQQDANAGCPQGLVSSCNNSALGGDMYQNFMDYTDDACMHLFTQDQSAYMYELVSTARPGLLTSAVCAYPLQADFSVSDSVIVAGTTVKFTDNSIGLKATSRQWTFEGGTPAFSTGQDPEVRYTQPGRYPYAVTLTVRSGNFHDTRTKEGYILVTPRDPLIYPNPAREWFDLQVPADFELVAIELLNPVGQLAGSWKTREKTGRYSLAGIAAGLYYVRLIQQNGQVSVQKLVVVK